jgi:hypothetical protein
VKVIIAGPRYKDSIAKIPYDDYMLIVSAVKKSGFQITEVVCGMAIGVDSLGSEWAVNNNIPIKEMPANWDRDKKAAGPIRNRAMAKYADAAVIIWDGVSKGTKNMIDEMIKEKKPYYLQSIGIKTLEDFFS